MHTEELVLLFLNGLGIIWISYLVADCIKIEKLKGNEHE